MIDGTVIELIGAGGNLGILAIGLSLMKTNSRVRALELRHEIKKELEDVNHGD